MPEGGRKLVYLFNLGVATLYTQNEPDVIHLIIELLTWSKSENNNPDHKPDRCKY